MTVTPEAGELRDVDGLARWLAAALGAEYVHLERIGPPPLNGASNDTLMVRASWVVDGSPESGGFVVRRPPSGPTLYHRYDLAGQYATMTALAQTDIPVPPLVGYEPSPELLGLPFYVMREVDGKAPPDLPPFTKIGWVLELSPREQGELYASSIAMMARVARLDIRGLPLRHLVGYEHGFAEQLAAAQAWYRWAVGDADNPVLDATLDWLVEHCPPSPARSLNWGDARIGNMLYRGLEPVAVLDWEMAAIGPAEVDLGWWLFLNRHHTVGLDVPKLPGFADDAQTVSMWEDAVGRKARDVHYYDVFAGFRFGIIVLRAAHRLIELGQLTAEQSFERVNGATILLAQMLGLPAPV